MTPRSLVLVAVGAACIAGVAAWWWIAGREPDISHEEAMGMRMAFGFGVEFLLGSMIPIRMLALVSVAAHAFTDRFWLACRIVATCIAIVVLILSLLIGFGFYSLPLALIAGAEALIISLLVGLIFVQIRDWRKSTIREETD